MTGLCRDCLVMLGASAPDHRCPHCQSPRVLKHPELDQLAIAHIDCDAFYASVEKRDNPELKDKPVLVGGSKRGVVSAACYVARLYGCRSAMPMFKALKACPDAVVIKPNMAKYSAIGREIKKMMGDLTPLVEPLSIDEAFLDLTGTDALHDSPPALTLARFTKRVEDELGLTASVGLSHNKFLAKIASDLDKPRGFAVIGQTETLDFLSDKPVGIIWGVGKALQKSLTREGVRTIADLRRLSEEYLLERFGVMGQRLFRLARGMDSRSVSVDGTAKSVSGETTFDQDLSEFADLSSRLWPLCETVSYRLKKAELAAANIVLKLKSREFQIITRSHKLSAPTQVAEEIYREAVIPLRKLCDGTSYRLIGIGTNNLVGAEEADPPDLLDPQKQRRAAVEKAMDSVREKIGKQAIHKGRSIRPS